MQIDFLDIFKLKAMQCRKNRATHTKFFNWFTPMELHLVSQDKLSLTFH